MKRNIKKAFDEMISQFATPALVVTKEGKIISQNSNINDILEILGSDRIKNIKDIDDSFGQESAVCEQFFFKEVNLGGQKCVISAFEDYYIMYVFNKSLSEERVINSVIEHIDEIIVIFDENGLIEKMNSLCDEILPFKKEDVMGKTIYDLVDSGEVKDPIIVKMLEAKEKVYQNTVYPSGKIIAYTAIPIFDSNNKLKGGVLTGRDMTRIANLEKRKQLEKDQDEEAEFQEPKEYVSVSKEMKKVKKIILRAAKSDSAIFVTGETGVGKEVVARYIHNNSARRGKPFMAVNCGAIPAELIESELFGYEEGAFSGAKKQGKAGIIELVDGGTLFLDEIGELPYDMQKKLLRVIQENEVIRVGGVVPKKVDVRYVSATNISIEELHNPRNFRQDLYFRLSVIPIRIPPLRSRKDDIIPLCNHFLEIFNDKYKRNVRISKGVGEIMLRNPWHGNVRELKNLVERLVVLSNQDLVGVDQFEILMNLDSMEYVDEIVKNSETIEEIDNENSYNLSKAAITINKEMPLDEAIKCLEQIIIKEAVEKYGSIQKAARNIGIDPSTIHRKIKSGQIKL